MARAVRLPAFAKVNLCLRVIGRRPDGYHELRTILQTIKLHDTLFLEGLAEPGIFLDSDVPGLPAGPQNLVWRAIEAVARELNFRGGVRARLHKRIPIARGLGGGSSDAAAALIGMLRLTGSSLPLPVISEMAANLGSDVPFFLHGGRALGVGRGEEIYPLPEEAARTLLVVSPADIAVSTAEAYGWLNSKLTSEAAAHKIWSSCALFWSPLDHSLSNDFEASVFERHPRLRHIKRHLLQHGAAGAALAGSGSAVFGVFPNPAQARRAARVFAPDRVFLTETLNRQQFRRALRWHFA